MEQKLIQQLSKYTDNEELNLDRVNFRLHWERKATNLVWYKNSIFYIPSEYLKLNSLINKDSNQLTYSINSDEQNILDELFESGLELYLQENIAILYSRLRTSGLNLNCGISVTFADNNDYSKLLEPIYLGNMTWINKS